MKTKIYALCDDGGSIRYIGKTINSLRSRYFQHIAEATLSPSIQSGKVRWLRAVLKDENVPLPKIILIGEVDGSGFEEERSWIAYGYSQKWLLTNSTIGGEQCRATKKSMKYILTDDYHLLDSLRNLSLSWLAKGIYSYLGTCRIGYFSDWHDFRTKSGEGRAKISRAIKELLQHGLIRKEVVFYEN